MILVSLGGMITTILLLISAALKFGFLGAIHIIFTAIAVGIWFSAASLVLEDEPERFQEPEDRKED